MKKILILFIFVLIGNRLYAQLKVSDIEINEDTEEISKVFNYSSPKTIKFSNIKEWVAKTFKDYKKVVQFEDETNCKLILKGLTSLPNEEVKGYNRVLCLFYEERNLNFSMTFDCKDDKYRIRLDNISIDGWGNYFTFKPLDSEKKTVKETLRDAFHFINYDSEIQYHERELKELNEMDLSKVKKKEISEIEKKKALLKDKIEECKYYEKEINNRKIERVENIKHIICELINSASKSIERNDDF